MKTRPVTEWNSGRPIQRRGSVGGAPTGMYPCAPGGADDYVYIHVATSRMWDALCVAIHKPQLADDVRFATGRSRMENARALQPEVEYAKDAYDCARGADFVVLLTEWNEFRALDLEALGSSLKTKVLIDLRNVYDPETLRAAGWKYVGVGRP